MKAKLFFFLAWLPILAQAQMTTVTEAQKQQALQHVQSFCTLLTQWSSGQRTLDRRIYELCSGNDCSAYDDVTTNKEVTMRNYLLGIQKKYPRSFSMQITAPSLAKSKTYYEPSLESVQSYQMGVVGTTTADLMTTVSATSYTNAYLVFDVTQSLSSLGKTTNRKIVYDVKAGKITAFIIGSGTYISYLEGIEYITKQDYKNAIPKFLYAAENNRSSLRSLSYRFVTYLYLGVNDFESAVKYAELGNDELDLFFVRGYLLVNNDKYNEAISCFLKCESIINTTGEFEFQLPVIHHILGLAYSMPDCHDSSKAAFYLKKSANEGYAASGWYIYYYQASELIDVADVSDAEAVKWLVWSAEEGYPPAFYTLGLRKEGIEKNKTEAIKWYNKAADAGNPVAMACLGKLLIEKGSVETGKGWLRKSLEGADLEKYLESYRDGIDEPIWPNSRSDVQSLLNSNTTASTPSTSQTPTVSTSTSSSYNYDSSYTRKYHRPFNQKQDNYCAGFTVGYIQKQWALEENGEKEKMGMFDDDKYLKGIQAGFRIDPQFGAGFGINTGIFYEYCWAKSSDDYDEYGSYHVTYEEHGLYLPLHLKFTMNFSKWFQLSFYGGAGFNYVISGNAYVRDDGETYGSENVFKEEEDWKRFNTMLEYGASIRINALQFDLSMSKGLTKWSGDKDYKLTQGRALNLSVTFCF